MSEFQLVIRLRTITIDFELGVSNRKFFDLGLKTQYKGDENLRDWFRSFAALSLLPLKHMLWGLQCLIRTRPDYPDIQEFIDYYHNTYGPFSRFPPHMYNY
ncbi:unnamed protein product [Didymodactylos carnosus]|uniref:Uncharacterized protein n=1 Tax=Didymodactylos carnosus TaxID=1234261 RepID=A0A8S2DA33_9BILA|nr:unnamed protein product [Didymodactylos carnosus]CAF3666947.1 unnamed protein product [Didymodactylos carnosus]CAF4600924.1 unnamed protein product [Didymodactylos carnosus]